MPRPKNKSELLEYSQKNYQKLLDLVDSYPTNIRDKSFPEGMLNRNIRDVLAHLHHWHLMMQEWYAEGMAGSKPAMPAEGYTWKTVPDLNRRIQEKYADMPLVTVRKELQQSFEDIRQLIAKHTNEELFTKKYYKWTGSTSLGAYLVSASSSHYEWAYKLIKKAMR